VSAGGAKFLELLLVLALVLGWGGYELWSLRRDRARDGDGGDGPESSGGRAGAHEGVADRPRAGGREEGRRER
jgi:hypothetical protein